MSVERLCCLSTATLIRCDSSCISQRVLSSVDANKYEMLRNGTLVVIFTTSKMVAFYICQCLNTFFYPFYDYDTILTILAITLSLQRTIHNDAERRITISSGWEPGPGMLDPERGATHYNALIMDILAPGLTTGGRPVPHPADRLTLLALAAGDTDIPTYWIDVLMQHN